MKKGTYMGVNLKTNRIIRKPLAMIDHIHVYLKSSQRRAVFTQRLFVI